MSSKATLFLIDGSSQMYRAYHAIRGLSGPDGKSTNAVYGFTTMLRKLLTDHQPTYIAASFDLPGPTFRDQMVTDYKANRAAMPGDLAEQIPWVHEACEALGVPVITSEGFEADDVIATLAGCAVQEGYDVAIVTGDKDFFQLVDERIRVFNPRDEGTWYDRDGVREKWGVAPEQVVDVLALMGDAVDNIKGVPGIGEKGAKDLIATWGSLDALLEHAGDVPQKKYREALVAHAEDARQSRELLRFRKDVPCGFEIDAFRFRGASRERCYALFSRLGFRSLTMEFAPTAETIEKQYEAVTTA
jgi:DNA polymerase-1